MLHTALHHPRKLWLRKAIFQVHLWAGLLVALYIILIALTGSLLVFKDELTGLALPSGIHRQAPSTPLQPASVAQSVQRAYPQAVLNQLTAPTRQIPAWQIAMHLPGNRQASAVVDATTGRVFLTPKPWIEWARNLHVFLLLNPAYGAQINAVGAIILMLLTFTGIVLWWPGLRLWTRGLRINFRANWRRINYDLHSAIGFWTLLLVFWWALSGAYFGFYKPIAAAINAVFPVRNMRAPIPLPASGLKTRVPLEAILQSAQTASPQGRFSTANNVNRKDPVTYIYMDTGEPGDFSRRDIVIVDTGNARVLSLWHYAEKQSVGDWLLWLMHPLHFGTVWGVTVKLIWFLAGLALAILAATGVLMYWNRCLRHRFKARRL